MMEEIVESYWMYLSVFADLNLDTDIELSLELNEYELAAASKAVADFGKRTEATNFAEPRNKRSFIGWMTEHFRE